MQTLGAKPGFFSKLVPVVARELGGAFPELIEKNAAVMAIVVEEEQVTPLCLTDYISPPWID